MIKLNCPNCKKRTTFSEEDNNKFKCENCNKKFSQCKNAECSNLVNIGVFCKDCVGKGMKSGGSLIVPAILLGVGVAAKFLGKNK